MTHAEFTAERDELLGLRRAWRQELADNKANGEDFAVAGTEAILFMIANDLNHLRRRAPNFR